ncbi:Retrovirus-related Pol polyprotein from transposon TNT 1-94 [Bienertia sinuspersici]
MSTTKIEITSPLYLHPSEGSGSIQVEKLEGESNYRTWRRSVEVFLISKRKIGFVTGEEMKDNTDPVKADAWVTCNNMVISWLMASVSDSIKQSFMFTDSAAEIWEELETKFSVSSGSRKYELCKSMYETKQQSRRISDFIPSSRANGKNLKL